MVSPSTHIDNIAPAIASCLGDLVTLCLIGLVSSLLIPFLHTPIPFIISIIVIVTALTSLVYTLRNKYVRPLLSEGWTPLFGAMIISSATGIVLDMFVSKYEGFAVLAVVISGTLALFLRNSDKPTNSSSSQVSQVQQARYSSHVSQQPSTRPHSPNPLNHPIIHRALVS